MADAGKKGISLGFNSPVVLAFSLISLCALFLNEMTDGASNLALFSVYRSDIDFLFFVRLVGHVFGHTDWNHFYSNMMFFLLIGPVLEEKYGSFDLIVLMVITAVVSGLVSIIFMPTTVLLGSSGIVYMMVVLLSASSIKGKKIPLTLILILFMYVGAEVLNGFTTTDSISQLSHVIGGICGAIFGIVLNLDTKDL
ncbi:rhomboid family intramembrane serine protease [Lachnospira multipara]|jgi:membrane associated rhomboid family serine protease|uniref:rhomboid family intramembrane serine protease n=1 Tax=Lachnospira multipara TaxID=28051 RepID=UPI00047F533F|nr:rhomboid family intramembrane serine protease [Lachnospira multipara]